MSDTWSQIKAFRREHNALKLRLRRRKVEEEDEGGHSDQQIDPALEKRLLEGLLNPVLEFPLQSKLLCSKVL